MAGATLVLRKLDVENLDDVTIKELYETELEPEFPEGTAPWFELGWTANAHPRDAWLATELVAGTERLKADGETELFAVARTDTGEIVHTYREMTNAENASGAARLVISAEVEADEEPDDDWDETLVEAQQDEVAAAGAGGGE